MSASPRCSTGSADAARPSPTAARARRATATTPRPRGRAPRSSSSTPVDFSWAPTTRCWAPRRVQADQAIGEADLVVFVVDGRAGLLPDDRAIAASLRKKGKRVLVAVNKLERDADALEEFAPLGFDQMHGLSAEHGQGVGDLLDAALAELPRVEPPEDEKAPIRIALVGRPNVGKSSLLNRFLGEERAVVSPIPGTTRDAVDSLLTRDGQRYLFVDTAGIRQVAAPAGERRPRQRRPVAKGDRSRGRRAADPGRGRGDARDGRDHRRLRARGRAGHRGGREQVGPVGHGQDEGDGDAGAGQPEVPLVRADRLHVGEDGQGAGRRAPGGAARSRREPPARGDGAPEPRDRQGGRAACRPRRTRGATPYASSSPPRSASPLRRSSSRSTTPWTCTSPYRRYLENQLREEFGFEGAPIVLKVRTRRH